MSTSNVVNCVLLFVVSGTKYGGSNIDFVYVIDGTNVITSHQVYIFSPSYPSQTAMSSNKCQVSDFQFTARFYKCFRSGQYYKSLI